MRVVKRRAHQIVHGRIHNDEGFGLARFTKRTLVTRMPALPAISLPGSKINWQLSGASLALTTSA